jgi:UDP-N-acetyl-D-galactosamine dehydrogenase
MSTQKFNPVVGVIGLGYVGLPLAVEFGRKFRTIGFDLSAEKIAAYREHRDPSGELTTEEMKAAKHLEVSTDPAVLNAADFIIVAVPTPIDDAKQPDLHPLVSASITAGRSMKRDAVVVYESTVYPGATEEVCVPVLERESGRRWKRDFWVGYSPERINPGDREHTFSRITKVVSGDTPETTERVAALYAAVVEAGVYRATSIRVAEAAKVIENTQRDVNIALMNELALIFDRMGISTAEVLAAAATKWNFMRFTPGLVGGHCIGVDPYYLTHKAQKLGYFPEVILSGRRINDNMGKFIAEKTVKLMIQNGCPIRGSRVNVLGITFKENVSDVRNSRVPDIIQELQSYGIEVSVHDPVADAEHARAEYGVKLVDWDALPEAQAVILAVPHRCLLDGLSEWIGEKLAEPRIYIDVKSASQMPDLAGQGIVYWRL